MPLYMINLVFHSFTLSLCRVVVVMLYIRLAFVDISDEKKLNPHCSPLGVIHLIKSVAVCAGSGASVLKNVDAGLILTGKVCPKVNDEVNCEIVYFTNTTLLRGH